MLLARVKPNKDKDVCITLLVVVVGSVFVLLDFMMRVWLLSVSIKDTVIVSTDVHIFSEFGWFNISVPVQTLLVW